MKLLPTGRVKYDVVAEYGEGNFLGSIIDDRRNATVEEALAWAKMWKAEYDANVYITKHEEFVCLED